jgi:hypothetical protein
MTDKEYVLRITDKEGCRGPGESIFDLLAPAQHEAMLMSTAEQSMQHFDSVQVCELVGQMDVLQARFKAAFFTLKDQS